MNLNIININRIEGCFTFLKFYWKKLKDRKISK